MTSLSNIALAKKTRGLQWTSQETLRVYKDVIFYNEETKNDEC
jgi:hypothetical protein